MRLVGLLNIQRTGIIDSILQHGLDRDVRLKSTAIIGMPFVPAHWEIRPLKRWATLNQDKLSESTDPDYLFRYIDIGAVATGFLTQEPEPMLFGDAPSRARRILCKGDTIVSTVRTYLKAVYFVNEEVHDLVASTGFAVLTPRESVNPELLAFIAQSSSFVGRV